MFPKYRTPMPDLTRSVGTGIGVCISANKVPGIRAALVSDPYSSAKTATSNNAQIITLGSLLRIPTIRGGRTIHRALWSQKTDRKTAKSFFGSAVVRGMGIHGEPGIRRSTLQSANDVANGMLAAILADSVHHSGWMNICRRCLHFLTKPGRTLFITKLVQCLIHRPQPGRSAKLFELALDQFGATAVPVVTAARKCGVIRPLAACFVLQVKLYFALNGIRSRQCTTLM